MVIIGLIVAFIGLLTITAGLIGYLSSSERGGPPWTWAALLIGLGLTIIGIVILTLDHEDSTKYAVTE